MEHTIGLFANPIYVNGDYSPMLRNMIQNHDSNRAVGSVLPLFTEAEKVEIKGQNIFYASRETVFYLTPYLLMLKKLTLKAKTFSMHDKKLCFSLLYPYLRTMKKLKLTLIIYLMHHEKRCSFCLIFSTSLYVLCFITV